MPRPRSRTPNAAPPPTPGAAFASAREGAGLTQARAAEALGVPTGTLRNWEQGRRELPLGVASFAVTEWGADPASLGLPERCPCCGSRWPRVAK